VAAERHHRLEPPARVAEQYADWHWELAWHSAGHSVGYRLSRRDVPDLFLKLAPSDHYPSLPGEAARMRWLHGYLPVPDVVGLGSEEGTDWLVTTRLPGVDGADPEHLAHPERLTRALAAGLRRFHAAAPIEECPFDFRLDAALAHVRGRLACGLIDPERDFHPEFRHLSAAAALQYLELNRPSEDLVVCHGDYCLPNILLSDWRATGFVDLGELGTADRWWDLAVATWSLTWNLGPGYEDLFLSEYGARLDPDRLTYYRLMYDVAS
jgi:kanamycin kinase